ncbi:cullin-1, putative [Entamoeba dispar SAW760]|uniref:Cullin-1, putative n=1 Tax=Entamoeba dispar (strain ATCC PRA-260 / SAW760) TaxID=370354 RepID=B0ELF5_ENTDS|nr:cullin-1, putative [Entamoeba dispar SAW760]EDR24645.1 cullin-1, putative [Entamoeba dispar SAW760]|eukprot:EDR24645.1 cullin-1, putative [Entamoeba dispar SAW760]
MAPKKKEAEDPAVQELFDRLEPFFDGILVSMKSFSLTDRAMYQQVFTEFLTLSGSNFYEAFINKFRDRLKDGFQTSMKKIRDVPIDENFPKIIKEDLDRWEYAKSAILVLFKPLDYAMANGASLTIDIIVKDKWNTDYLHTLNDTFELTTTLTRVFSDSRRSGNKMSVLPVKNILMLYKRENIVTRGQVPLIKMFEDAFCKTSSEDYKVFATEFFKEGVHGFLPQAKQFMEDEEFRIENAMDDEIGEKMNKHLQNDFLKVSLQMVYEKYDEILEQDKEIEFQAITRLFGPINKLDKFAEKTKNSFMKVCQNKMENAVKQSPEFIRNYPAVVSLLFELLDRLEKMQQSYFLSNPIFKSRLDTAFKDALITNKIVDLSDKKDEVFPRILANYSHMLLKKGSKIEPDQEKVKENIVKLGKVLQFVGNRDVFEMVYQKNFQDRLVLGLMESSDLEMYMINELSNICDRQVSHKLHTTFQEYNQSSDILEKFKGYCTKGNVQLPKFDFNVVVFSNSSSQNQNVASYNMPSQLKEVFDKFSEFYKTTQNKKLTLNHTSSTGIIQFSWLRRPIQITCRFYQLGLLMLFNDNKEITYAELGTKTALNTDDLAICMSGMVSKGLLSNSTGKEFKPESVFKFNMAFKPKMTKLSVMQADKEYVEKEQQKKNDAESEQLEETRNYVIQAKQVRIMKQRRTMKYVDLINETIEHLRSRFNITSRMARKNIEYLINKEYFKRSDSDREVLEYLA